MATLFYKWLGFPVLSIGFMVIGLKTPGWPLKQIKPAHPIHISTAEIVHNATDKTLEITCKIFWDDFESILTRNNKNKKVDLTNEKSIEENNKHVFAYLNSHLNLVVDGKVVSLNFVGFEKEDVVIYSYLEVTGVSSVKNISITDSIMHDMFDDQTNIIHVIVKGERKSTRLDYPAVVAKLEF